MYTEDIFGRGMLFSSVVESAVSFKVPGAPYLTIKQPGNTNNYLISENSSPENVYRIDFQLSILPTMITPIKITSFVCDNKRQNLMQTPTTTPNMFSISPNVLGDLISSFYVYSEYPGCFYINVTDTSLVYGYASTQINFNLDATKIVRIMLKVFLLSAIFKKKIFSFIINYKAPAILFALFEPDARGFFVKFDMETNMGSQEIAVSFPCNLVISFFVIYLYF